jgi:hypothetical protein
MTTHVQTLLESLPAEADEAPPLSSRQQLDDLVADLSARPGNYAVWFRQYLAARGGLIGAWIARGR